MTGASAYRQSKRKSTATLLLGFLIVLSVGVLFVREVMMIVYPVASPGMEVFFRPRVRKPFASEVWRSPVADNQIRYAMANDLVISGRLRKLDLKSVFDLLGKPDRTATNEGVTHLDYDLTSQGGLPAQFVFLPTNYFLNNEGWVLRLDARDGRVETARIRIN